MCFHHFVNSKSPVRYLQPKYSSWQCVTFKVCFSKTVEFPPYYNMIFSSIISTHTAQKEFILYNISVFFLQYDTSLTKIPESLCFSFNFPF